MQGWHVRVVGSGQFPGDGCGGAGFGGVRVGLVVAVADAEERFDPAPARARACWRRWGAGIGAAGGRWRVDDGNRNEAVTIAIMAEAVGVPAITAAPLRGLQPMTVARVGVGAAVVQRLACCCGLRSWGLRLVGRTA